MNIGDYCFGSAAEPMNMMFPGIGGWFGLGGYDGYSKFFNNQYKTNMLEKNASKRKEETEGNTKGDVAMKVAGATAAIAGLGYAVKKGNASKIGEMLRNFKPAKLAKVVA